VTRAQRVAVGWFKHRALRFRVVFWLTPSLSAADLDALISQEPGSVIRLGPPYGIEYTRGPRIRVKRINSTMRVPA